MSPISIAWLLSQLSSLVQTSPVVSSELSTTLPEEAEQSKTQKAPEPVSRNGAGLGDTKAQFEKIHGPDFSSNKFSAYEDNYIHASYTEDVTVYISFLLEKTDKSRRTKQEALELVKPFLPKDAVKTKELQAKSDSILLFYESQKLANAMPEEWKKVFWKGVKPGSFLIILNHEPGNPDATFAVTLAADNSVSFLESGLQESE
ncbi:MAG: hypothetical protein WA919_13560 [Coleofasciculaceae cyanobacterium]